MKKAIFLLLAILLSCSEKETVDLIIYNANIYNVDDNFSKAESIAIKDGVFREVGTSEAIKNKFQTQETIDANQAVLDNLNC